MRIMLLLFVMGIVPAIIIEAVMVQTQEERAVSQRTITVQNQCAILCDQLANLGYIENPSSEVVDGELGILTNIYGGRIMIVNRDYKVIKDTFKLDQGKYILSQRVIDCFNGDETSRYDKKNQYIEMAQKIASPDEKGSGDACGVMLISVSTTEIQVTKDLMEQRGILVLTVLIAAILVLGYFLSGLLVKPFQKISSSIEALADGYAEETISVPDYLETEMITNAFNRMMRRIKTMDDSREEFVANVSHELKTPMASMKVLADALNSQPDAPVEQYREFMQDISKEIDRENQIITDLLSLVKMDRKAQDLNIETININDLLTLIIRRLKPLAEKKNVELILESFRPVNAEIDQTKIALAFTNIIENAIKYNKPEGGWVRTSLNADHKYFYVTIADSGIGIPKESVDHIFERFYRVDKSHSREIGGTGLGLAISRSAIVLHRGAIKVYSEPGEGTTFSIRVPLVYIA
jgi:signal transduction histidine kinase